MDRRNIATVTYVLVLRADVPSPFTDNVRAVCSRCHSDVLHRPHIPTPSTLICLQCYPDVVAESGDDVDHVITTATILELQALTRRN
jgi:hypothetical protein